jgi:hypothetical protein
MPWAMNLAYDIVKRHRIHKILKLRVILGGF